MVGGEPQAAVAQMHRAVGRRRRPVPRHPLSRRHLRQRLHLRLVHHAHGASSARPRLPEQPRYVPGQRAVAFMRHSLDSGAFKGQQAQWDNIDLPMWAVGNWSGMGLHLRGATEGYIARGVEAQEAAHPLRHALPSILQRGRTAGSVALLRPLAQGHRQRRHGRAAGQARDPHRPRRVSIPPRERMAARAHAMDQALSRPVEAPTMPKAGTHVAHASRRRPPRAAIPPAARPMPAHASASSSSHAPASGPASRW